MNNCTQKKMKTDKMDKLLEIQNLPRSNHDEVENLHRPIAGKEIECESESHSVRSMEFSRPEYWSG